jgi:cobyrinic acid a,c-diamide synthase
MPGGVMTGSCPAIVVAGSGSGVGKTSITLGLTAALTRRGMRVQTFKAGPDFLDPTYLSIASGRKSYNLDTWMCGADYARKLFAEKTYDADIALVEGAMGMYDGASSSTSAGSSAEIAELIGAPVLLVVNAKGAGRSLAAVVKGFVEFERGARIAGVVANFLGSENHAKILREALESAGLPPLMGGVIKGAIPELASRHLGLVSADARTLTSAIIAQLGGAIEAHCDIDAIISAASCAEPRTPPRQQENSVVQARIGIARDDAFHFYYHDSLEALERAGAELIVFSPIRDAALPDGLDGLYIGGGYPEVFAQELSRNTGMIRSVAGFAGSGKSVYAECGGLMYLSNGVETTDGTRYPLAGVLPVWTRMRPAFKSLGYAQATLRHDTLLGGAGDTVRGHMFHYSELVEDPVGCDGWSAAYTIQRNRGGTMAEGYSRGNILATYLHASLGAQARAVESFVERCRMTASLKEVMNG